MTSSNHKLYPSMHLICKQTTSLSGICNIPSS